MSSLSAVPQCHARVSVLSKLIAAQSVDTSLWLRAEMVRLVDPIIDSLLLRLIMSHSVRPAAQPFKQTHFHSNVSELCQLIEQEKQETNRLHRGQMDRIVNSLFIRLTNQLLVNTQISELVQISPSNHQTASSNASNAPSTMNNSNDHLSTHQITSQSTPSAQPVSTSLQIKQKYSNTSSTPIPTANCPNVDCSDAPNDIDNDQSIKVGLLVNKRQHAQAMIDDVKEEYNDNEDEGEYMSDCDDCAKGICGLDVEIDDTHNDAETGVDMQIGLGEGEIEDQNNASVESDLMAIPDVIDDSNQSAHNANDLSLINESEHQIRSVRKSSRNAIKQNCEKGKSAQPVIAHNNQSIPSSSGLQSSTRKRIHKKVFGDAQLDGNIRKSGKHKSDKENKRAKLVKRKQNLDDADGNEGQEDYANNKTRSEESIVNEPATNPIQPNLAQRNRNLKCSHCHKSFDHQSTLQRHLRVHTGERPFQCEQCDKRFKDKSTLAKHQLIHQNIKRFRCDECEKKFTLKCSLDTHLLTHSGERPFACRHCAKSFTQSDNRTKHEQAIHLHVKPFRCKQCGHTATQRPDLIKHIRTVHFGLPQSIKQQRVLNIIDDRDPKELVEKVTL